MCIPLHSDSDRYSKSVEQNVGTKIAAQVIQCDLFGMVSFGDQVKRVIWIDITWALKNMLQPRKIEYPTWSFVNSKFAPEKLQPKGAQKEAGAAGASTSGMLLNLKGRWVDDSCVNLGNEPGSPPMSLATFWKKTYNGTYELTYIMYIYICSSKHTMGSETSFFFHCHFLK